MEPITKLAKRVNAAEAVKALHSLLGTFTGAIHSGLSYSDEYQFYEPNELDALLVICPQVLELNTMLGHFGRIVANRNLEMINELPDKKSAFDALPSSN